MIFKVGQNRLSRLKRSISPCLEVGVEKFFDSHMENYIGKLKMIKWNRFDTDCKMNQPLSPAGLASQVLCYSWLKYNP